MPGSSHQQLKRVFLETRTFVETDFDLQRASMLKKSFQNLKKWIKFKSGSFVGGIATCSLEFSHDCRRRKIQNDPERKEKS